jgi:DNA-binding CsgD family transcriptional regulator/PAS domain-containing protein
MSLGRDTLPDLIGDLYEASLEPVLWPSLMARIAAAGGGNGAMLFTAVPQTHRLALSAIGIDPAVAHTYTDHFGSIDPLVPAFLSAAPGTVLSDRAVLPKAEMQRTTIYAEWAAPNGIREAAGVLLQRDWNLAVALTVTRPELRPFEESELRNLALLAPHVARALRVQRRLAEAQHCENGLTAALQRLRIGALLVTGDARVVFANRSAEETLAGGDGLRLGRDGLCAATASETISLRQLVAGAARPSGEASTGGSMRLNRPDRTPLGLTIVPVAAPTVLDLPGRLRPLVLALISDPARVPEASSAEWLRTIYGLTPSEARVAFEIARGRGMEAAAERLGVKRSTVVTHLRQVFAKADVSHQAELTALVERLAALEGPAGRST